MVDIGKNYNVVIWSTKNYTKMSIVIWSVTILILVYFKIIYLYIILLDESVNIHKLTDSFIYVSTNLIPI